MNYDWIHEIKTPCYVIDEAKLIRNLETLQAIEKRTGCKILLAQKAFSMYSMYPLIRKYISGTTASGLYEARLGHEAFGQEFGQEFGQGEETHVFSPAYTESDFSELVKLCSHIVFNSCRQWAKYKDSLPRGISAGLRINPEHSTQDYGIYDPCSAYSRLGATLNSISNQDLSGIEGLHFHTLCQQNADALASTLDVVFEKFGFLFPQLKWVNFGGGHHITRSDYNIDLLESCIKRVTDYGLKVYLEPGEAIALDSGYLATEVLDIVENGMDIAILDASAACHMPDVLEMPYRPEIIGAGKPFAKPYTFRLGGNTCLAGDIIGDYSFDTPLKCGDRLIFTDMAIYTMVKNNTFNGVPLPSIAVLRKNRQIDVIKDFGYEDFKKRLS